MCVVRGLSVPASWKRSDFICGAATAATFSHYTSDTSRKIAPTFTKFRAQPVVDFMNAIVWQMWSPKWQNKTHQLG